MDRPNERIAYFNGDFVPESHVLVPFRDRGFRHGDGVFDTARTVRGEIFRLKEHIDRLYRSLRYLRIEPPESPDEMGEATEEVVRRNLSRLPEGEDYWVFQNVSRGPDWVGDEPNLRRGPTVVVHVMPLPLRERATLFRDGIELMTSSFRRIAPDAQSPRAKMSSYINLILADMEVKAGNPKAWASLLDVDGRLNEGTGQNLFLVRGGELLTPRGAMVLEGVSRGWCWSSRNGSASLPARRTSTSTTPTPRTRRSSPRRACASARCGASTTGRSRRHRFRAR